MSRLVFHQNRGLKGAFTKFDIRFPAPWSVWCGLYDSIWTQHVRTDMDIRMMRMCGRVVLLLLVSCAAVYGQGQAWLGGLAEPRDYIQKRVSSYDHSGGNGDYKTIAPGETLTILDEFGPGIITHIWFTFSSEEMYHL